MLEICTCACFSGHDEKLKNNETHTFSQTESTEIVKK
jgi:hypothetical protein